MLEKQVVAAGNLAVSVFDDDNQRLLTDELNQIGEHGYSGVVNTLLNSALDQGQAGYSELMQIKLMHTHLARGIENIITIISGFKPVDRAQAVALVQQQVATLTLDSDSLTTHPHPLLAD